MSRMGYPWAAYFWMGDVVVEPGCEGTERERWICRSEEPLRMYVPPREENVRAFTGAVCVKRVCWRLMGRDGGAITTAACGSAYTCQGRGLPRKYTYRL
jgi:hypothetical protein